MACKNGHETINEIGNCYTCGEPNDGAAVIDNADVASTSAIVNPQLSLKTLERLRADAEYIVSACDDAIKELIAKKDG